MTQTPPAPHVTVSEIADLLAWARSLAEQRDGADPTERVAFQQAKTELLDRITNNQACGGEG